MTLARHVVAAIVLPGTVVIVIPALLLLLVSGDLHPGWTHASPLSIAAIAAGGLAFVAGLALWAVTVRQLAVHGRGTLAPWAPTQRLVVQGVYRHVRNPMITGVGAMLVGEGLALGSWPVLVWCAVFASINAAYIPLVEERGLVERFGGDYRRYRMHVPRWIPRPRAWREGKGDG